MKNVITLEDIKGRIIKDEEGVSNYIHVSIEEMDWLVEQAEKLNKIRAEADELYAEEIDLSDFGERVSNII